MTRLFPVLAAVLLATIARAEEPPKKLTPDERKALLEKLERASAAGVKAYQDGKVREASQQFEEALKLARQFYPASEFPDGHQDLASLMGNLAVMYQDLGRLSAAEPLIRDALAMRRKLFRDEDHSELASGLNNLAALYWSLGRYSAAEPLLAEALAMRRRLFKEQDHPGIATSLNNLGTLYTTQGNLTAAESVLTEALAMRRRLAKDADHPELAKSLSGLASLYATQGKSAAAEKLCREALEMRRRLFKDKDHPDLATSMNNLATHLEDLGKVPDAGPLYEDALAMRRRLFKDQDHPDLAVNLNNLASYHKSRNDLKAAEPLFREALAMWRRLYDDRDHPDIATGRNNLAALYQDQGKLADAETEYKNVLAMWERMNKGQDHPDRAITLNNLDTVYHALGRLADAEEKSRAAVAMGQRLVATVARVKPEGESLTFLAYQPLLRDGFLSIVRARALDRSARYDPAAAYPVAFASKGQIALVAERRHTQARAASDPAAAKHLAELTAARRLRAELLVAPDIGDRDTRSKREEDLKALDARIAAADKALRPLLPHLDRLDRLAASTPADLQKVLPAGSVVVDFLRYTAFAYDPAKPGKVGETRTPRYVAFVVSKDKVQWVDLDEADKTDAAIAAWVAAISGGKDIPAARPNTVRELVWAKVRKELPAGTNTVYICPDAALCRVPWAALPGDAKGSVLLDDFALATIPHAPFLLDKLLPAAPRKNPPTDVLAVGGVKFDATQVAPVVVATRSDPLLVDGTKLRWVYLPGTATEADAVATAAAARKQPVTALAGDKATPAALLAALPSAKVAHVATHGFFADPAIRSAFRLDAKEFDRTRLGERVGRVANSPLLMTGLVLAGANDPKAAGRGIVTGEALVDLDLSGLELAVLSACETGVGEVAGGEGVFGLQRAFHLAGARDVVASGWKVDDAATAALMGEFYRNLWDHKLAPAEALRRAQLALRRADPSAFGALALRGFGDGKVNVDAVPVKAAATGNHPRLWAAFALSGPGR